MEDTEFRYSNESSSEDEEICISKGKQKAKGRAGRKSQWPEAVLNDLIDVILNNETYKRRLILTNTKNSTNSEIYQAVIEEVKSRCDERNFDFTYNFSKREKSLKDVFALVVTP